MTQYREWIATDGGLIPVERVRIRALEYRRADADALLPKGKAGRKRRRVSDNEILDLLRQGIGATKVARTLHISAKRAILLRDLAKIPRLKRGGIRRKRDYTGDEW